MTHRSTALHSIRTRVTVFTLVIVLASIWVLTLVVSETQKTDLEQLIGGQQRIAVTLIANQINGELQQRLSDLEGVAASGLGFTLRETPQQVQTHLDHSPALLGLFNAGVWVSDRNGTVIASDLPVLIGKNYADRDYMVRALQERQSAIGKPIVGKVLKDPIFAMAAPIFDANGIVIGAVAGITDLSKPNFLDPIKSETLGKAASYLIVAPQHGLVVTASDRRRIMEPTSAPGANPLLDRRAAGDESTIRFVDKFGKDVLSSAKFMPVAGWYLAITLPAAEVFAPIDNLKRRAVWVALLLSGLAAILTWWLLHHELSPMLLAVKKVGEIAASGQAAQKLDIMRADEVGDLIGGFNQMLETLGQREAALTSAAELESLTGEVAKVGGWKLDLTTGEVTYSHEAALIHEFDRSHLPHTLAQNQEFYAPEVWPIVQAAVQAAIEDGTPYDLELPFITAKGRHIWVREQGFAARENGKTTKLYGTFQDITERKNAERALHESQLFTQTIANQVPGLLGYWTADLTCGFANKAYLQWAGRTAEEMKGIDLKVMMGEKLFEKNAPYIQGVLAGQDQQFERRLKMLNGDVKYVWAQYTPHWKDGKVAGFLALVTDITELKTIQMHLQASLHEKSALLLEVHHRVKNNLQVISSLLRMESRRSTVPEAVGVLKTMQSRIQTMAQLHQSLYRSGTFASVDLGAYLGQIATQAFQAQRLDDTQVQLTLSMGSVPAGMDQAIACGLLVNELVSNCLKHGFADGRTGEVRVELQPADPATIQTDAVWRLRVSDTGVGLPPDFEAKRTTSLGLQLVGDLSVQAGGTLTIQSQAGAGAEFAVVFKALEPVKLVMPNLSSPG